MEGRASRSSGISEDQWKLEGCPHNGPLLLAGETRTLLCWYTGGQATGLYLGEIDESHRLSQKLLISRKGRFAGLALTEDGDPLVAYNELYEEDGQIFSRIQLCPIHNEQIHVVEVSSPRGSAGFPVVATTGSGSAIVAWIQEDRVHCLKMPIP